MEMGLKRIDENLLLVEKEAGMQIEARILARSGIQIEEGALRQLKDACRLRISIRDMGCQLDVWLGWMDMWCLLRWDMILTAE